MISRRRKIIWLLLFSGVILGHPIHAQARFEPGLNRVKADLGEVYRKGCLMGHDRVRSGPCRFGDIDSKKEVVLFGDSHAMQWGPGVIRLAKEKGWKVIALTRASCPAALVHIDHYCDTWRRNSLGRIRKMRPGLVVVASAANSEAYDVLLDGVGLSRSSSEGVLIDGMIGTLRRLDRWSTRTVVIRDQAVTPFSVTACLRVNQARPGRCGFRPDRSRSYSYDFKATRRVRGASLVDPQPMLCPEGWCRATFGEQLIYRNHGHLAASFTRSKYQWLGRKLGDPWK